MHRISMTPSKVCCWFSHHPSGQRMTQVLFYMWACHVFTILCETEWQEVKKVFNSDSIWWVQITLIVGYVVFMNLPEVPVVAMKARGRFNVLLLPDVYMAKSNAAGIVSSPTNRRSTATAFELVSCVQLSEMDAHCMCQHTVKLPHPSHLEPFPQNCLLEQKAGLSPWGAPNVTNQMRTEKCINTMKTTWTQLVAALNKNVYSETKPIVWGLNKPAVFLFNFIVCASACV